MHKTTIAIILIFVIILTLFTHKFTLVFLSQKFLKSNQIEYSKVEGTLFNGVILYDVKYKNIMRAKKIQLNYKLISFIKLKPIIKNIQTQQLYLNIDALPKSNKQQLKLIPFTILKLNLQNTTFIINKKRYIFNLKIKNLFFNHSFNTNNLKINLKSYYVNADITAKIVNNKLIGESKNVAITKQIQQRYLYFIKKIPKYLSVKLKIDSKKVDLKTTLSHYALTSDNNFTFHNQVLEIQYFIDTNLFQVNTHYTFAYKNYLSSIKQQGTFNTKGEYNSTINVHANNLPQNIPINHFNAHLSGNIHNIHLEGNASDYFIDIQSNNYKKYKIRLTNNKLKLSFIDALPEIIKNHQLNFDSYSSLRLTPFSLESIIHTSDKYAKINATLTYNSNKKQITAKVIPFKKSALYKNYNLKLLLPMTLNLKEDKKHTNFSVNANKFQAFIAKKEDNKIEGYGNFATVMFTLNGTINKQKQLNLNLHTIIPSIRQLLKDVNLSSKHDKTAYNGEVHINSNIHIKNNFSIQSTIRAPFLSAKTDSQNLYVLKNILLRTSYKNKRINIYNYTASYKEQKFHSNKVSKIYVDHNVTFHIEKFFIYDNLILKGLIEPLKSKMSLNIHSDKFKLKTENFDLSAKTNINIDVNNTQKQTIDGNITLLSGEVSYQPQHDYSVNDDDIIIVQDIQKQKKNNLFLNININATNPIRYKTKKINVHFIPKITLKKKAGEKTRVFGKVIILNGSITTQGKKFTFDKSQLIFSGEKHLNPKLNVKLHFQTVDYKDIIILISNTLNSPVLIFSSNPAMSQNDIISYILFDESADALFDNSSSQKASINYLLLGTGIKTIFNNTTGIHVDTLNILNNKNGTLGYEVGARLNKRVRVVYKNDTTSSMILQYSLAKSLRIDVDIHDTGQGVYFIYTKDFKGF